jgi:2-polyprenyl-6-methoxyphenol hydroxylase-like FAD-dependent oxidoreductase
MKGVYMKTDVLIVGAGPTGLMLANQLARRGVCAMIIDRHSGPAQQSRAMAVQARTMEIYSKMGLIDEAFALGARGTGANMWASGQWTARIPIGDIGQNLSPFPFILMLGQDDNERIMGKKLNAYGVEVQWRTELVAFEQQPGHVDVKLRLPNGETQWVRAKWVAGCDGSRSPVREISGITFPGEPYQHVFFVADTVATGSMKPNELNVYLWEDGFHLFFPMKGKDRWRVIGILPKTMRSRDDITFDELAPAIQQEAGANLVFQQCDWFSVYRIHHRAAERFRDRRCFLLGDAAHVHSPAGAQGMNTGLQDAYNLAWKLALVIKGQADAALLGTYEAERIPVANRLLRTTDRVFQVIVQDGWFGKLFRTKILARVAAFAMTRERVRKLAFRTISQIGVRYRRSPLSQTLPGLPKTAPRAGDRFPWLQLKLHDNGPVEDLFEQFDDTRFNLLVIGQPQAAAGALELGPLVRTHVIPAGPINDQEFAREHIPQPSFYLLRPDGHVGLAGPRFDAAAVARYLADMGIPSASARPRRAIAVMPLSSA